jgi:hypothetical protein
MWSCFFLSVWAHDQKGHYRGNWNVSYWTNCNGFTWSFLATHAYELISHDIVFFSHNTTDSAGLSTVETISRTTCQRSLLNIAYQRSVGSCTWQPGSCMWLKPFESPRSLELISQISQSSSNVFLSQQISEQYFQLWLISQTNRAYIACQWSIGCVITV